MTPDSPPPTDSLPRRAARYFLILFYGAAGVLHLWSPRPFLSIMPPWVPAPELVVALTGVAELAGALGLMLPRFRRAAGVGLALYALCVWPANFQHAMQDLSHGTGLPALYHIPRLAAQPLIIWLALWAAGVSLRRTRN
ncbi:MAG: DoxX family protein [Sphingomonadaceae bacterium]|nr:DoxX family protein [Sphingomonadaceae bacterium]